MSSHVPTPTAATPHHHASTSANPGTVTPASYHPALRPLANPTSFPFHRIDTHQIKQQLHDALGEAGLPYWKALNAYLLGQLGRHELEALVRGWLKGKHIQLHNQLLASLLHNASSPQIHHAPTSPLNMQKRRKGGMDAPDFDSDPTFIEPRQRVQHWVMGMGGRERDRVRRAVEHVEDENAEVAPAGGAGALDGADDTNALKRTWSVFNSGGATQAPLSQASKSIPSAKQLGSRMSAVAKSCGLNVSPESSREIGEFMGVGLDTHLGDVLHSVVHLTARDRPGGETIRVPLGVKTNGAVNGADPRPPPTDKPMPPPTLQTMQYLFNLAPSLHPLQSPTLYKLEGSISEAQVENSMPPGRPTRRAATMPLSMTTPVQTTVPLAGGTVASGALTASPVAMTAALSGNPAGVMPAAPGTMPGAAAGGPVAKMDGTVQTLVNTGLLKIDKAGHGEDGAVDRKREKKHNLHWKYEDPALILKDLLG